jgi:uncharacterized protein
MTVFVDASAFIAITISEDQQHELAARYWQDLLNGADRLITSNYVAVETLAILQRRSGIGTAQKFLAEILPAVDLVWVDASIHEAGVMGLAMSSRSGPNIVDCTSFALMQHFGISRAFTFDRHFAEQGFEVLS